MILVNVNQNTSEWSDFRRNHIGASDCAAIMGVLGPSAIKKIWDYKMFGKEGYVTDAMRRGSEMEKEALAWYNSHSDNNFLVCSQVGRHKTHLWQIASLDGYAPEVDWHLEIKCPGEKVMKELSENKIPKYWSWQIQHQLSVTNGKKALLLAYSPSNQCLLWVDRDEAMIAQLIEREEVFYKKMTFQV